MICFLNCKSMISVIYYVFFVPFIPLVKTPGFALTSHALTVNRYGFAFFEICVCPKDHRSASSSQVPPARTSVFSAKASCKPLSAQSSSHSSLEPASASLAAVQRLFHEPQRAFPRGSSLPRGHGAGQPRGPRPPLKIPFHQGRQNFLTSANLSGLQSPESHSIFYEY